MNNDLISREALLAKQYNASNFVNPMLAEMVVDVSDIEDAPAVDAVPVVRCKDCKHSRMYCFGTSKEPVLACLEVEEDGFVRFATAADPEGFCSRGERKE